jgi:hypothetical protein
VVGKKSLNGGVDVTRATYDRSADGATTQVQILANSKAVQDLVVQDGDNGTGPGRLFAFPVWGTADARGRRAVSHRRLWLSAPIQR